MPAQRGAPRRSVVVVERALDFQLPYGSVLGQNGPDGYYQYWFRDPQGGPNGFNLSNGLEVEFTA